MNFTFNKTIKLKNKNLDNTKLFILDYIKYIQNNIPNYKQSKITIRLNHDNLDTYYNLNEFINNYSNKLNYNELSINIFNQHNDYIIANIDKKRIYIEISTSRLTEIQTEEILNTIYKNINQLFNKKANNKYTETNTSTEDINNTRNKEWSQSSIIWTKVGIIAGIISAITGILAFCK